MKIAVAGAGYVGLSLAVLLAQNHEVTCVEIHQEKVDLINSRKSPIRDPEIEDFLATKTLNLTATTDWHSAFWDADFVIIATPTNYDDETNSFDTTKVEDIIEKVLKIKSENPDNHTIMVVKSTIPVGYIESIRKKYQLDGIFFSPEFLREGHALYDNLYPSRIVIGSDDEYAHTFANLLLEGAIKKDVPVKYMNPTEAEAVKLFANTYLALRVAYFNELDTYAEMNNLSTKDIIDGVCLDPRIGLHYNNPSFGYGGYCLPKDTKQLRSNYEKIPQTLITAVVESNKIRKEYIADRIIQKSPKQVGIYRLTMKTGSDNFRSSAIQDIVNILKENHIKTIIYEPTLKDDVFNDIPVKHNLEEFKSICDVIIANRDDKNLFDVRDKVYTRNIYARD